LALRSALIRGRVQADNRLDMAVPLLIPVTPAAMLAAVACVVAGGPWFADGLRALRQRRALAAMRAGADAPLHEGAVTVRGNVVLASPLFAPLSGRPCAGYVLEVGSTKTTLVGRVSNTRAFHLATRGGLAEIEAEDGLWHLGIGTERTAGSVSELSENLQVLLASTPELRWLVAFGGPLVLRERALFAGTEVAVLGVASRIAVPNAPGVLSLVRTGTDDASWSEGARGGSSSSGEPTWVVGPAEPFEHCVVSDGSPESGRFAPPAWRLLGTVLGPALSLAGLVILAEAAGRVLDGGR
jgi:hypothetical protein